MDAEIQAYCDYVYDALRRENIDVLDVEDNPFDEFSFGLTVICRAPWDQYNRAACPGERGRTIRRGETVHDVIAAYRRAYGDGR